MRTKSIWVKLLSWVGLVALGVAIGFWGTYLYFVSKSSADAGAKAFVFVGGASGIVSAFAFLIKTFVEHRLGIAAEQSKVIFAETYKLKAAAIIETYRLVSELKKELTAFISPTSTQMAKEQWQQHRDIFGKALSAKWQAFNDYYEPKKLLFNRKTRETIEDLNKYYSLAASSFDMRAFVAASYEMRGQKPDLSHWDVQVPPVLVALEEQFREVLGITDED